MQSRKLHGLIQPVNHIVWQKCGDHIQSYVSYFVSLQVANLISVHIITHWSISNTVKFHFRVVCPYEFLVCLFNAKG